jgi:guanylate kinase
MINGVIISGCSGVGKSTVIHKILATHPEFHFSVSCTTRAPRPDEEDGVHYKFINHAEFERRIKEKYFIEWEKVYTDYYGTPKAMVECNACLPKVVIFELDTRGALNIKAKFPQFTTIALLPPTIEDLSQRLIQRGSETRATISRRQEYIREELQRMQSFDYAIINSDADESAALAERIILSLNNRLKYFTKHIEELLDSLKTEEM